MHRVLLVILAVALVCPPGARAQVPAPTPAPAAAPATDLDRFMATALLRRDVDRKTLTDYVLDEVESFEILGPGRVPVIRMRHDFTWYVRDGIHVRSPVKVNGVPIGEDERRAYENRWVKSEEGRRKFRTEREAKREQAGKGPALSAPSINEPRFISESYFLDFKFEPGNYYLAGKEALEGRQVLKIDYLPTKMFDEDRDESEDQAEARARREEREKARAQEPKPDAKAQDKKKPAKERTKDPKEAREEEEIERKMDKTSQVTLWVDPATHQIVKYTFDNVWLDFLPGGWLVKVDDLRASMQMGQPFPDVWLPRNLNIRAGISLALGPMEFSYKRDFSNYRKADVLSKITVPK